MELRKHEKYTDTEQKKKPHKVKSDMSIVHGKVKAKNKSTHRVIKY